MNVNFNSGLFSGSGNSSFSGMSGLYGLVGEYNNIRSGAYYKALKAYYADDTKKASSTKKSNKDDKTSETEENASTKAYSNVKSEAAELTKAAAALTDTSKNSLFVEKEQKVKDEQGKETTVKAVDRGAIESAVKDFVTAYNDTLSAANKSGNQDILRNTSYMTNQSKIFSRALSEVGISVNKDNTLSVDDEKLKNANLDNLKTLFNGKSSYASFVSKRADMVSSAATKAASSTNNFYNKSGNYSKNNYYSNSMDWYL